MSAKLEVRLWSRLLGEDRRREVNILAAALGKFSPAPKIPPSGLSDALLFSLSISSLSKNMKLFVLKSTLSASFSKKLARG